MLKNTGEYVKNIAGMFDSLKARARIFRGETAI